MNSVYKLTGIILALFISVSAFSVISDNADANPGESEDNPLIWYNNTIILLPEVVAGEITDAETQVLVPPTSLVIDWGDGNLEVKEVDGYVTKGSVEIVHTYAAIGIYHITCTPQNTSGETGYTYDTYELWMDIKGTPSVYFYDGDEEILDPVVATNGYGVGAYEDNYFSRITKPADPVKEDYRFEYWTYNGEEFDFDTAITSPILLKAKWTAMTPVSVTVDGIAKTVYEGDTVADLAVPTRTGYTFSGWYSDSKCTVPVENTTVLTEGMSLYSGYVKNTVTVTVDGKENVFDAGKTVADVTVPEGKTGWYSDENCTVPVAKTTVLADGMKIYSKTDSVVPATVKVTIDGKEMIFAKGTTVSQIEKPTEEDYTFSGWYSDEKYTVSVEESTVLTEGMTLYSCFTEDEKTSEITIEAVAICIVGAIIAFVGLRYHPVILVIGAAIVVAGVADIFGLIEVIR